MANTNSKQLSVAAGPTIILSEPQLGENIGFAARAMLNGGLINLRIINPRDGWPNKKANAAAAGANDIIKEAQIFNCPEKAISDLQRVFAMTARPRDMIKRIATPRDAIAEIRALTLNDVKVGILFGPERKGLDNNIVTLCDTVVQVPLNPANSSMNLGHAVMIMAYEWFQMGDTTPPRYLKEGRTGIVNKKDLLLFLNRLELELDARDFFQVAEKRSSMVRNIRNIFQRAELTVQEIGVLHGIVSSLIRSVRGSKDKISDV